MDSFCQRRNTNVDRFVGKSKRNKIFEQVLVVKLKNVSNECLKISVAVILLFRVFGGTPELLSTLKRTSDTSVKPPNYSAAALPPHPLSSHTTF